MTEDQAEKLQDYLDGFLSLRNTDAPPVGAVLVKENIREGVLIFMKENNLPILENSLDNMLENDLQELSKTIEKGEVVIVNSNLELSATLNNIFLDFSHGKLCLNIPSQGVRNINPIPESAKALFVLAEDLFDNSDRFSKVISSVCRL